MCGKPPVEPIEPTQDMCCGTGCDPCVFDRFYDLIEIYENKRLDYDDKVEKAKSKLKIAYD